ncbi:hypothetical protein MRB53_034573 [Persea americana]|uniref:Uncharacterized protein n=1 Tax=Persea americana TaxID=3435 RepID=A0ACC2K2A9_PERAE|nr:hypothetical protein MRB53_034573 [Persea americana]
MASTSRPGYRRLMVSTSKRGFRRVRHAIPAFVGLWIGAIPWALLPSDAWALAPYQVFVGSWPLALDQVAAGLGTRPLPPRDSGEFAAGSSTQVLPLRDSRFPWG